MQHKFDLPIKGSTPSKWAETVLQDFDRFLGDHAACERKAAALAMSFIIKYPDQPTLVEPMIALAREELEHFQQVFRVMNKRKVPLPAKDEKDVYVNAILANIRHGRRERLLDRLVMSGLIEARGWERFAKLGDALVSTSKELADFYHKLAEREAGHYKIFIRLAKVLFDEQEVDEAVSRLADIEQQAMNEAPITWRLH